MKNQKMVGRTMPDNDKPVTYPFVVLREEFDDWAVLFNPDTADAVGINPVGVVVWKLMERQRGLEEIVAEIKDRFADVPDAVAQQISTFINDLSERGFVGYELNGVEP
jgi:SynChlorMet cassette protein ScmD